MLPTIYTLKKVFGILGTATLIFVVSAINQFFYSWWTAVGNSGGIATANIRQMVQIFDIPSNTLIILQHVILAP